MNTLLLALPLLFILPTYLAWGLIVVFAFLGFIFAIQQGKAYTKNTWFFKNKTWLILLCIVVIIVVGIFSIHIPLK